MSNAMNVESKSMESQSNAMNAEDPSVLITDQKMEYAIDVLQRSLQDISNKVEAIERLSERLPQNQSSLLEMSYQTLMDLVDQSMKQMYQIYLSSELPLESEEHKKTPLNQEPVKHARGSVSQTK